MKLWTYNSFIRCLITLSTCTLCAVVPRCAAFLTLGSNRRQCNCPGSLRVQTRRDGSPKNKLLLLVGGYNRNYPLQGMPFTWKLLEVAEPRKNIKKELHRLPKRLYFLARHVHRNCLIRDAILHQLVQRTTALSLTH